VAIEPEFDPIEIDGTEAPIDEETPSVLSQEHLMTIFNASHDVFFVLDGEKNTILHVNETVERVLGFQCEDLVGSQFPDLVCESVPNYLEHCQFFDGVFGPVAFRRANGGTCQADVTAAVIPWDGVPAVLYTLRDATQRTALEEERAALIHDLQQALATVRRLSGLLPICASCKRIRDDEGYWETVEGYISAHSNVHFSHGICPTCRDDLYPGLKRGTHIEAKDNGETLERRFWTAMERLDHHPVVPDRVTKARLYALRQQGTFGDYSSEDFTPSAGTTRVQIDSWKALYGMAMEKAQSKFIDEVAQFIAAKSAHSQLEPSPEPTPKRDENSAS